MSTTNGKVGKVKCHRDPRVAVTGVHGDDHRLLVRSFELSLRAANKSPKTITGYTDTVRGFCVPCRQWDIDARP